MSPNEQGKECKNHRYIFHFERKVRINTDYACIDCGLHWRCDETPIIKRIYNFYLLHIGKHEPRIPYVKGVPNVRTH